MSTTSYGTDLVKGLSPAMDIPEIGRIFKDTLPNIGAKVRAELAGPFHLEECDKVIIMPKLARNQVGASDMGVTAFFVPSPGGNIYFRGKGKNGGNTGNGGRINMIQSAGAAAGGTGPFQTTADFDKVIKPLCKTNDKGDPIMVIKQQRGGIASVELDFNAVMCLVLGIKPKDPYDFTVISIIPTDNNFTLVAAKTIIGAQSKGSKSNIDYAQLEREIYRRYNPGNSGGNNGGRQY